MNEPDAIADIIAEMRRDADADDITPDCILGQKLNYLADRLEAAHKRELSKICPKTGGDFGQLGDAAKMREAMIEIRDLCMRVGKEISPLTKRYKSQECQAVNRCFRIAVSALAAPPRNCDVGTAEEQSARFDMFCYDRRSYEKGCGGCPLIGEPCCELAWAQMPY